MIRVSEPDLTEAERNYLLKAFDSGWISSTGEFVNEFETKWANVCDTKYALSVSNGTVALNLILAALNIGPGDEVIVPSFTFVASVNAIKYVGATPIFAESSINNWGLDPLNVENLITKNTKAIIAVHLYGVPADLLALNEICINYNLFLIEDAAEAPFTDIEGKKIGSFGIAASFSFYGNKVITSGEGGAVTCSDDKLYSKMRLLRGQGMSPNRRYYFQEIGFNFRLTNMQCAILCAQLERHSEMLDRRFKVFEEYDKFFKNHERLSFQSRNNLHSYSPWLYTFRINDISRDKRDEIIEKLESKGIETRPTFIPVHSLPPYSNLPNKHLRNAVLLGDTGISLPTSSKMSSDQVERVGETLFEILKDR